MRHGVANSRSCVSVALSKDGTSSTPSLSYCFELPLPLLKAVQPMFLNPFGYRWQRRFDIDLISISEAFVSETVEQI